MKIPVNGISEFFQSLNEIKLLYKDLDVIMETLTENLRSLKISGS